MIPPEDPFPENPAWQLESQAHVLFFHGEHDNIRHVSRQLFGRELKLSEYAGLAGAPDSASVEVGTEDDSLYLEVHGSAVQGYRSVQYIHREEDRLVLVNENFQVSRQRGRGIGLAVFHRQLYHANQLNIDQIEVTAGRGPEENGYYTWPRFGFDGPLPTSLTNQLPPNLQQARTVLDLIHSVEGRLWWKEHGQTIDVVFQMSQSSRSWEVFNRYLSERH